MRKDEKCLDNRRKHDTMKYGNTTFYKEQNMKKSGFLMLLLVALLIFLPVAAWAESVQKDNIEIKTTVQEEVTAVCLGCEIMAVYSVVPIKAESPDVIIINSPAVNYVSINRKAQEPLYGFSYVLGNIPNKYDKGAIAGRNQLYAGYV